MDNVTVVEGGKALTHVTEVLHSQTIGRPYGVEHYSLQHVTQKGFFKETNQRFVLIRAAWFLCPVTEQ